MSASRKYQRYFKPISREPFSVAGTVRAQGRVGQTSHTRSNTGTLFKGNTPIGHGGENGSSPGEGVEGSRRDDVLVLRRFLEPPQADPVPCVRTPRSGQHHERVWVFPTSRSDNKEAQGSHCNAERRERDHPSI